MVFSTGTDSKREWCLLKLAVGYVDKRMASVITDAGITRLLMQGIYNMTVVLFISEVKSTALTVILVQNRSDLCSSKDEKSLYLTVAEDLE